LTTCKVRWFGNSLGYGFAVEHEPEHFDEDGNPADIFIHYTTIVGERKRGSDTITQYDKSHYKLLHPEEDVELEITEKTVKDKETGKDKVIYAGQNVIRLLPDKVSR